MADILQLQVPHAQLQTTAQTRFGQQICKYHGYIQMLKVMLIFLMFNDK